MKRRCEILALAGVCAGLLLAAACDQPAAMNSASGQLPHLRSNMAPRLNASTYTAHGELLERRGEYARAVEQYRRALELAPDLTSARNRLGVSLNRLGQHAEASAEFRRAITESPREAFLYNNLGFSLYLEKRYDEAEPVLAQALQMQPQFLRARMNHGLVLARLARYDEALSQFTQVGTPADAHFNVAVLQAENGHYAAAARSLELALREDPDFTAARDHLREISRLAAAEEAAAQAIQEAQAAKLAAEQAEAERLAAQQPQPAETDEPAQTAQAVREPVALDPPAELAAHETIDSEPVIVGPHPDLIARKTIAAASLPRSARYERIRARLGGLLDVIEQMQPEPPYQAEWNELNGRFTRLRALAEANDPACDELLAYWEERLELHEVAEK